jgi:hypothetical protein
MTLGRTREPEEGERERGGVNEMCLSRKQIAHHSHLVTMPSIHTRLPRNLAERVRGVKCFAPKLQEAKKNIVV